MVLTAWPVDAGHRVYRESMAAAPRQRRRLHPGQKKLLYASIAIFLGSWLPWFSTNVGNVSATGFSFDTSAPVLTLSGQPGLWTWMASFMALAAALAPWRSFSIANAGLAALVSLGLPLFFLYRALSGSSFFAQADWLPGPGLVFLAAGAVMCIIAVRELLTLTEVGVADPAPSN